MRSFPQNFTSKLSKVECEWPVKDSLPVLQGSACTILENEAWATVTCIYSFPQDISLLRCWYALQQETHAFSAVGARLSLNSWLYFTLFYIIIPHAIPYSTRFIAALASSWPCDALTRRIYCFISLELLMMAGKFWVLWRKGLRGRSGWVTCHLKKRRAHRRLNERNDEFNRSNPEPYLLLRTRR